MNTNRVAIADRMVYLAAKTARQIFRAFVIIDNMIIIVIIAQAGEN
jgi:hypothetical protein